MFLARSARTFTVCSVLVMVVILALEREAFFSNQRGEYDNAQEEHHPIEEEELSETGPARKSTFTP